MFISLESPKESLLTHENRTKPHFWAKIGMLGISHQCAKSQSYDDYQLRWWGRYICPTSPLSVGNVCLNLAATVKETYGAAMVLVA